MRLTALVILGALLPGCAGLTTGPTPLVHAPSALAAASAVTEFSIPTVSNGPLGMTAGPEATSGREARSEPVRFTGAPSIRTSPY